MDKIRETELLHAVSNYINCEDATLESLREEYEITPDEYWWFFDELKDRDAL